MSWPLHRLTTTRMDFGPTPTSTWLFFQAEDGIRDDLVTGVQTCALPISSRRRHTSEIQSPDHLVCRLLLEIGRTTVSTPVTKSSRSSSSAFKNNTYDIMASARTRKVSE